MQEYSTTVKSTDVGLTWESHYSAKKEFEVIFCNSLIFIYIYIFYICHFYIYV